MFYWLAIGCENGEFGIELRFVPGRIHFKRQHLSGESVEGKFIKISRSFDFAFDGGGKRDLRGVFRVFSGRCVRRAHDGCGNDGGGIGRERLLIGNRDQGMRTIHAGHEKLRFSGHGNEG